MTTLDIIKHLCQNEGITISALEKEMKYGNGSLSKATKIPSDRILELSKRFDVSMEYLMTGQDNEDKTSPFYIFENYLASLGYHVHRDDPEHNPFLVVDHVPVKLEHDTLSRMKQRIDTYVQLMLDSEVLGLRERQIQKEKADKERLAAHMLNAAHAIENASEEDIRHDEDVMDDENF